MGNHSTNPRTSKDTMKIYILLSVILVAQEAFGQVTVKPKAPSTFQNCDCQCNSDTWTDGNEIKGNCKGRDRNGALFCYVSGRALRACRDIQQSSFLPDNNGRLKYYSYEACTTPARNRCGQNNFQNPINQNLGDSDLQTIQQTQFGGQGGQFGGQFGGQGGQFGGQFGGSNNFNPNRPIGSSSNFNNPNRPIGGQFGGSNNFNPNRPIGGSNSFNNPNRPIGGSNNFRPGQTLGSILSGTRGSTGSKGSSDATSSSG